MIKKNVDVRKAAKDSGVFLWEIADKLGVSEPTLNRWLRKEMPDSQKAKFYSAIEQVKLEHQAETANDERRRTAMLRITTTHHANTEIVQTR